MNIIYKKKAKTQGHLREIMIEDYKQYRKPIKMVVQYQLYIIEKIEKNIVLLNK